MRPFSGPIATFRNAESKYPFCPGCGHSVILDALNTALVRLQLDPAKVVIVTDIGCVGMSDQYFATHAFHGLHGRSVAYATGIKLANPDLTVIVLMGDGGCGIGGHHLLNAARRNVGIAVLVLDNFNFGMTGGEHSVTTPHGALTASTAQGNLERPLDICATVAVNGGGFVCRLTQFDDDLAGKIAEAVTYNGFALLDIWDLCTAHFARDNKMSKAEMMKMAAASGMQLGLVRTIDFPEYASAYRAAVAGMMGKSPFSGRGIEKRYESTLAGAKRIVLAGAAGGKVKSAATILAHAGVMCGLWCTQRDDYPTTVMSGHSVSEVILSPTEVTYTGVPKPDILAILSVEGLSQVQSQLEAMDERDRIYVLPKLAYLVSSRARKILLDSDSSTMRRKSMGVMAVAAIVHDTNIVPMDALKAAVRMGRRPQVIEDNLHVLETTYSL